MYQGEIGYFESLSTGNRAWLWKLRKEGTVSYFNIDTKERISALDVDENERCSCEWVKEWNLVHMLHTDDMLEAFKFNPPVFDISRRDIRDAVAKVERLKAAYMESEKMLSKYSAEFQTNYEKYADALREFNELANKDDYDICYVHGKHNASDTTDWCWYAPAEIAATIMPGDIIEVDTRYGKAKAIATVIEHTKEYRPHKSVIRNLTPHEKQEKSNG